MTSIQKVQIHMYLVRAQILLKLMAMTLLLKCKKPKQRFVKSGQRREDKIWQELSFYVMPSAASSVMLV